MSIYIVNGLMFMKDVCVFCGGVGLGDGGVLKGLS